MPRWIWLPSERTLANTVLLFRREFEREEAAESGWIVADSRYRLWINGERVQWGPAPCDPRHTERDPVDLGPYLRPGRNCVGVEVLYYGHGEGTWPFGTPGLLADFGFGTDSSWRCVPDPSRPRGTAKRWYLRSLQERVDLRAFPHGWNTAGFDDSNWLPAMELPGSPEKPALAAGYGDYANDLHGGMPGVEEMTLGDRSIYLMQEEIMWARLREWDRVEWKRDPEEWFDFRVPGIFEVGSKGDAELLTYDLEEIAVGFPRIEIEARAGTVVHLMVQESHDHAARPFLDSHFHCWSRWTLAEGMNILEPLDYEACRFLQLHIQGEAAVKSVELRRRLYAPWDGSFYDETVQTWSIGREPKDDPLDRLFRAARNTLVNSAQDIVVDGMARERQQYSGDGGHQLHPVRQFWGANELSARFLRTYAKGMTMRGVFLDSWPAYDRLARLWQRNVGVNDWGPIIDHSIGFMFDHYHHWMQSGDLEPARENWPVLSRFLERIEKETDRLGLMTPFPEDECTVWVDHDAFPSQAHKRCALNLYAAAMLTHAAAPLAEALGLAEAKRWSALGESIVGRCVERYWDVERGLFVGGHEVGDTWVDDRSLATAVLYGFNPERRDGPSVDLLADLDSPIGHSYPANVVWNHWALAKAGRTDSVIHDLRTRWAAMPSVIEGRALGEHWKMRKDSTSLFSHCPQAPLISLVQAILGYEPITPGGYRSRLNPSLGDIGHLRFTIKTPPGEVTLEADPHVIRVQVPEGMVVEAEGGRLEGNAWVWDR